jgi:hypothetical protein
MLQRTKKNKTRRQEYCHDLSAAPLTNSSPDLARARWKILTLSALRSRALRKRERQGQGDPLKCCYSYLRDSSIAAMTLDMRTSKDRARHEFTDAEFEIEIGHAIRWLVEKHYPPSSPMTRPTRRRKKK